MGKRSAFPRRERDNYPTPLSAVLPLLECLPPYTKFYEPCRGENDLVGHLTAAGHVLVGSSDEELDARTTQYRIPKDRSSFRTRRGIDRRCTRLSST